MSGDTYLFDTNVLLRLVNPQDSRHDLCRAALRRFQAEDSEICTCAQNYIELWNVATRPAAKNGLGLAPRQAGELLRQLEPSIVLVREPIAVFEIWRDLVTGLQVRGSKVHDARLVAVMLASEIRNVLTFDLKDFRRYRSYGISAVSPADVVDDAG